MNIFGKEYGFRFTVGAQCEISRNCENGDLANMGALLSVDDYDKRMKNIFMMASALNKGHIDYQRVIAGEDVAEIPVFKRELFSVMGLEETNALVDELVAVIGGDSKQTVETEEVKNADGEAASE